MLADILHGGVRQVHTVPGSHLLAVQCDGDCVRLGARGFNDGDRFARRGAGRHDVIDDQHPALHRRTNQQAAFAVVFGFFAVVGVRKVAAEPRQFDRDRCRQGNAFVGGPEQHVELDVICQQAACIELRQPSELGTVVKQAGIEKIRR